MVLFVLRKFIIQTRMRSHPLGLDVCFLVGPYIYFHTSCVRTAKALARLRGCAGSPEPSLVAYVISTIISWAGSFLLVGLYCTLHNHITNMHSVKVAIISKSIFFAICHYFSCPWKHFIVVKCSSESSSSYYLMCTAVCFRCKDLG